MTPASIRNNNPGAMEPGPSSRKFGSTSYETLRWTYKGKPATNKIATFPTPVHGAAAMFDLLYSRYTGSTVSKAIERWCGGYYASDYTKSLEQKCGVGANDALTKDRVRDADTAILLAKAMARVEAGQDFPMSDEQWAQAHAMAFSPAVAPEPTPENDVPYPSEATRTRVVVQDVATKAAGAGALATTGGVLSQITIPPVPQSVTDAATNASAWQGIIGQFKGLAMWGIEAWPLVLAAGALYGVVGHLLPWIASRRAA